MDKTATVEITRIVAHPVYGKRMKRTKKYHVHDEKDTKVGDVVRFVATKPYSKMKKWKVVEIVGDKKNGKSKTKKASSSTKKSVAGSGKEKKKK